MTDIKDTEIEKLRAVIHGLMKILARPWIDGGVTWPEWDAAMQAAEDALNIKATDIAKSPSASAAMTSHERDQRAEIDPFNVGRHGPPERSQEV